IKDLPPLPLVVQKLLQVMDDPNSSADDISQVLSADNAMAAKVLKLVNSSFYGLSGQVASVPRAIVILGLSSIRNLALGLGVTKLMARAGNGELQQRFWAHSIATAAACETVARATQRIIPEEAFVAGLLHDIGHLILMMAAPEEFRQVMAGGPDNLVQREIQAIGMAHTKAGQKLLRSWKLPTMLCDTIRFHHTAKVFAGPKDPLISMVALGDMLAGVHGDVYERSLGDEDFRNLVKVVGLDVRLLDRILRTMDERIEQTKVFLKLASDGELDSGDPTRDHPSRTVAMICTDELRVNWTDQVLKHFGHRRVGMKEFFTQAGTGGAEVDLVILDPLSLTTDQLQRVAPVLQMYAENLLVFDRDEGGVLQEMLGRPVPTIPVAFSRQDLDQV
ncbi:hypothetical protein CSB20_02360, partial [bacterium DOLZORAL124_64_63]